MNLALSESLGQELQLQKESTKSELRNSSYEQKKFEYESEQISKFVKFKKLMWQVIWIGENKTKL